MLIKKDKFPFLDCNLAGFEYTEGYSVLPHLHPGCPLRMVREDENPYDHKAVAIFYGDIHIGYIPACLNAELAQFLDFGYADIFECVVTSVDKDEHPNEQVQLRVNLLRKL